MVRAPISIFSGKTVNALLFQSRPPLSYHIMPNTPQPLQESHLPPSLPSSPLPKRSKVMAQSPQSSPSKHLPAEPITNSPAPPPLSQSPPLLIQKLSSAAKTPTRGSKFAAGYDLYSARATTIPSRGKSLVDTDLAIAVPEGTCPFSLFS